jgi:hypothetical protein
MIRKELRIALTALASLGGPEIPTAEKLIAEPPLFLAQLVSGVLSALDEVERSLESERLRVNAWLVPGPAGGKVIQIRDLVVDSVARQVTVQGKAWRPRGSVTETSDGGHVELWHQYDEIL